MEPLPNLPDLALRWRRARETALLRVLSADFAGPEVDRAQEALRVDAPAALREVFRMSHALGRSWAAFHRVTASVAQVAAALPQMGVACVAGAWSVGAMGGQVLKRAPCSQAGLGLCAWWRDATDGLASGMSAEGRHARHRSAAAGDTECVDALFDAVNSPLQHGSIPEHMEQNLGAVSRMLRLVDSRARVAWLGFSEGVLHYRLDAVASEDGPQLALDQMLHTQVGKRLPGVHLRDASARAVFAG